MKSKKVNDLLEDFYKYYHTLEELSLKQGVKGLTTTELHILEAIGLDSVTMNELSEKLGITMGTATVAVNKLEKKECIFRKRCEHDRRKVHVSLSRKGIDASNYHENFHESTILSIIDSLSGDELDSFIKIFSKITNSLKSKLKYVEPNIITSFPIGEILYILEIKGSPAIKSFFKQEGIHEKLEVILLNKTDNDIILQFNNREITINHLDSKNIIATKKEI